MLLRLKKNISIFTLAVVLFPIIMEELHTFAHRNDFHCTEVNAKHFHHSVHHCPICDFVLTVSDKPFLSNQIFVDAIFTRLSFTFYQSTAVVTPNYNYPLRAPPTIA